MWTARTGFVVGPVEPPVGSTVIPTRAAALMEPRITSASRPVVSGSIKPAGVASPEDVINHS